MSRHKDVQTPAASEQTATVSSETITKRRRTNCQRDLLAHFQLTEQPFSLAPDPRFFFRSKQHQNVLGKLLDGLAQYGGVFQLTGEFGSGKTLLYRSMLEHLPPGIDVAFVRNAKQTPQELLVTICDELRVVFPYGSHSLKGLRQKLRRTHTEGRRTVVIVEEAQNLEMASLVRLLLLSDLTYQRNKLLQIILIGQPTLHALLAKLDIRQLAEKITAHYQLEPFSTEETSDYVAHRLRVAGVNRSLFTTAALRSVYRHSLGNPRMINRICRRAMISAFTAQKAHISAFVLQRAAQTVRGELRRRSGLLARLRR